MDIFEQFIATIAPHLCICCGAEGNVLCANCARALPLMPAQCYRCGALEEAGRTCHSCRRSSALQNVWTATTYDGVAKELIAKLKFERAKAAAEDIAATIAARATLPAEPLLVTHVPTANARVRQRGYDQAALIARELSGILGVPHATLLARLGANRQLGAGREERQRQLRDAFRPLKVQRIAGATILLVDDVITTGSTLEAAARALKAAGATRVYAVAFARA